MQVTSNRSHWSAARADNQQQHGAASCSVTAPSETARVLGTVRERQDGRALISDRPALALPGILRKIDLATCNARKGEPAADGHPPPHGFAGQRPVRGAS